MTRSRVPNGHRFVLVPGAGGAGWYWRLTADELIARGHHAVPVDLPADDPDAGLAEYAEAVVAAAAPLCEVTLVAQSMGAYAASMAVDRLDARLVVLLNPMIPAPGETPGEWWASTGQGEAMRRLAVSQGRARDATSDEGLDLAEYFLHDVPPEVVEASAPHQRDQADKPFDEPWPLSSWPEVRTRVLIGRDDRFFPPDFQARLARERLGLAPELVSGGHLAAMAHPVHVAERLETCADEVVGAARAG